MNRRQFQDHRALTPELVRQALLRHFPSKHDTFRDPDDLLALSAALQHFGIDTVRKLRWLVNRHRKSVCAFDRAVQSTEMLRFWESTLGHDAVWDRHRRQYWFSNHALLRLVLEAEFGDAYRTFADSNDAAPD